MAKKQKEVELPERSALESLAKEMNEVMGLDPKIKFNRKTTDEELIEAIKENAVDSETDESCIYESDFEEDADDPEKVVFTDEARETLEALELEIGEEPADEPEEEPVEEETPVKKGKKAAEKEEKPAPKKGKKVEKEEEPEEEPEEEVEEKPAKKGSKKEEKAVPEKKGAKKEEKPAAKKKEKSEKFTRYMAVATVFKEGKALTEDGIAERADDLYSKKGGNSGIAQSERIVDRALQLLRALGLTEEKSGKIKYIGE